MGGQPLNGTDDAFILRYIASKPKEPNSYNFVLLGSSLFGRFKYMGKDLDIKRNPCILNLGMNLGGDRIQNVQSHIDKGLLHSLKHYQPNLRAIYIQMGDGNLTETGLQKSDAEAYGRVIKSLRDELPDVKIVITAFFVQRGLSEAIIGEANKMLKEIAEENGETVSFLPFGEDQKEIMSDDRIHLNNLGYRKWSELLVNDMKGR